MTFTNHLKDKIVLVTGATSGIGKEAAAALAGMGATLVLVGRNPEKTAAVARSIESQTGNPKIQYIIADLSAQAEVRQAASEFLSRHDRLDVLVNNAGAIFMGHQQSVDGFEMTFALNHLAYFLLTNLLMDALKAGDEARIVNVSSEAHRGVSLNFDDLQNERNYTGWRAYSQSKLANLYFTYALAGIFNGDGLTANAMHPGFVATNFGRSNGGIYDPIFRLAQIVALSPEAGAETIIHLASSPDVEGVSGQYFVKKEPAPSSEISTDINLARTLWDISLKLTGLPFYEKKDSPEILTSADYDLRY